MITYEIAKRNGFTATDENPFLYLAEFINKPINLIPNIKKWAYDIECYPDFFSLTAIPADTSKQLIKKYAHADITNNIARAVKTLRNMNCHIFIIRKGNPIRELRDFIDQRMIMRIGFNNIGYDDPLLGLIKLLKDEAVDYGCIKKPNLFATDTKDTWTYLPITTLLYRMSNEIINIGLPYQDRKRLDLKGLSLDVLKVNRLDMLGISLKKAGVALRWYRIQDLPFVPGAELDTYNGLLTGKLFSTLTYNINDVLITIVGFKSSRNEFKMRAGISKSFGVPVYSLSRSAAGDKILERKYAEISGKNMYRVMQGRTNRKAVPFVDIIDESIKFETPEFQKLYHDLIRTTAYVAGHEKYVKFVRHVIFDGTKYKMALGGLHSVDRPMYLKSTSEFTYRDADVRSYYPYLMLTLFICPRHLDPNIFLNALELMINDRVDAKAKQKDTSLSEAEREVYKYINEGLKISINNIFGKLGYHKGWLYDLRAMYKTTINGQLKLFRLIEMLYLKGIHTVSANTDGIICKVPTGKEDEYYAVCKQWQKDNNLVLEYNDYDRYLGTSVNDYIAINKQGSIKRKGDFVTDIKIDRGYSAPIVAKSLSEWFLSDIPLRDTIYNDKNIHNFVYSQKVGHDMELFITYVDKSTGQVRKDKLQNTDRYYVSKSGMALTKQYIPSHRNYLTTEGKPKQFALKKGEYVRIINDLPYNYSLSDLNRTYYVRDAQNILDKALRLDHKLITGTRSTKKLSGTGKSGIAGTLFD